MLIVFTDIIEKGYYTLPDAIKDIALTDETFVSKMRAERIIVRQKVTVIAIKAKLKAVLNVIFFLIKNPLCQFTRQRGFYAYCNK